MLYVSSCQLLFIISINVMYTSKITNISIIIKQICHEFIISEHFALGRRRTPAVILKPTYSCWTRRRTKLDFWLVVVCLLHFFFDSDVALFTSGFTSDQKNVILEKKIWFSARQGSAGGETSPKLSSQARVSRPELKKDRALQIGHVISWLNNEPD